MLGRILVRACQGLFERCDELDADPLVDQIANGLGQPSARRDQDGLAVRAVLSLGEEVGGAHRRIGGLVCDDEHLARPGGKVDADPRRDEKLRRCHEPVPRADDLVDRRDRLRPVRQRGDGLRPPDCVDLTHAELPRRGQNRFSRPRRRHCDPPHARHFRRHHSHHE